jgi:hypothetical protein
MNAKLKLFEAYIATYRSMSTSIYLNRRAQLRCFKHYPILSTSNKFEVTRSSDKVQISSNTAHEQHLFQCNHYTGQIRAHSKKLHTQILCTDNLVTKLTKICVEYLFLFKKLKFV